MPSLKTLLTALPLLSLALAQSSGQSTNVGADLSSLTSNFFGSDTDSEGATGTGNTIINNSVTIVDGSTLTGSSSMMMTSAASAGNSASMSSASASMSSASSSASASASSKGGAAAATGMVLPMGVIGGGLLGLAAFL